ncbi:hypothetical protein [Reichenbachiella versicolor]|uniref:hypothetical protein n=1 Tax=Reichenbachiella versicolor TaxID=1821036 RepID=UPI000D6E884A|nr:hypothetical protein [Reichenbachiella versicolor]
MKNFRNILIATIIVLASFSVATAGKLKEASAKLNIVIVEQNTGKVLVGFEKKETESVRINIYDPNGYRVYTERVKSGTVMLKRFDVSQLPAGEYSYEVTNYVYSEEKAIEK